MARSPLAALTVLVAALGCAQPSSSVVTEPETPQEAAVPGIQPVAVVVDARTGFKIGGVNPTALIRQLPEINGRSIADLEADMRPGQLSRAGFLGPHEKLLEVMAEDNRYLVEELGLNHQELAWHLRALVALSGKDGWDGREDWSDPISYRARRFQVKLVAYKGFQESPFHDGLETNMDATIRNVATGKELRFSVLVPLLIERYGFYEGKGTSYRVEPRAIVEVLGFLRPRRPS